MIGRRPSPCSTISSHCAIPSSTESKLSLLTCSFPLASRSSTGGKSPGCSCVVNRSRKNCACSKVVIGPAQQTCASHPVPVSGELRIAEPYPLCGLGEAEGYISQRNTLPVHLSLMMRYVDASLPILRPSPRDALFYRANTI
jgi:hypothetical protein